MEAFKKKLDTIRAEADAAILRAESAERELDERKKELATKEEENNTLAERITNLEAELDAAQIGGSDSKAKLRELELRKEELARKAKSLETENSTLEKKLGETTEKRDKVKADLEALGDF
ncbi:MAG: hypothetical protein J3Q66DRAFT_361409 [Benniella sp.]|nr:MAG: hypothetical protein J3Q66DRAFT_361409 [Benniella sp.]